MLEPLAPHVDAQASPPQLAQHLDAIVAKVSVCLRRLQDDDDDMRQDLAAALAEAERARLSLASYTPPSNDLAAAARAANYFSGVNPDGTRHSRIDELGQQALRGEIRERSELWYMAGLRLFLCAQISLYHGEEVSGGASLRKASNIIVDQTSWNGPKINEAWASYKDVAHISAGVIQVVRDYRIGRGKDDQTERVKDMPRPSEMSPALGAKPDMPALDLLRIAVDAKPELVLRFARSFQHFGLTFIPQRSREPLLPSASTWRVAGDPEPLSGFLRPMHPIDVEALRRVGAERR